MTPIKSGASKNDKSEDSTSSSQSTEPIVHRKDIIRIPDLTIKRTDLLKKPLEIHCSMIYFGLVEFNVESNSILLKETEFEFKLKSKFVNFFFSLNDFIDFQVQRWKI